jgi:hypothetical protein
MGKVCLLILISLAIAKNDPPSMVMPRGADIEKSMDSTNEQHDLTLEGDTTAGSRRQTAREPLDQHVEAISNSNIDKNYKADTPPEFGLDSAIEDAVEAPIIRRKVGLHSSNNGDPPLELLNQRVEATSNSNIHENSGLDSSVEGKGRRRECRGRRRGESPSAVCVHGRRGNGWSVEFSDENGGASQTQHTPVKGYATSDGNGDKNRIQFDDSARTDPSRTYWTAWFSEEGSGRASCPPQAVVTGMQCAGSRCDNKRLRCEGILNGRMRSSRHSPWFENQAYSCPGGWFITEVSCRRSRCAKAKFKCQKFDVAGLLEEKSVDGREEYGNLSNARDTGSSKRVKEEFYLQQSGDLQANHLGGVRDEQVAMSIYADGSVQDSE